MMSHSLTADVESGHVGGDDAVGESWRSVTSALGSFANRARTAALPVVTAAQELAVPLAPSSSSSADPSRQPFSGAEGSDESEEPRWASWAKTAAQKVRQQAAVTAGQAQVGLERGLEKAKSVDWGEQVKDVRHNVSRSFERVSESASTAGSSIQERATHIADRASNAEWAERAEQARDNLRSGVSRSFEAVSEGAGTASVALQERGQSGLQSFQEGASTAAGSARGALSVAHGRASGAASLAMNPVKLAQFMGVFFVGLCFIMMSMNFLPFLLLAPQKFALLFTTGSLIILSSFVVLNGIRSFAASMAKRERLPFSVAYLIGLLGTLWATLIKRSYLLTTFFAIMQAVMLVYFVATSIPGGRTGLNALMRLGSHSARTLVQA